MQDRLVVRLLPAEETTILAAPNHSTSRPVIHNALNVTYYSNHGSSMIISEIKVNYISTVFQRRIFYLFTTNVM